MVRRIGLMAVLAAALFASTGVARADAPVNVFSGVGVFIDNPMDFPDAPTLAAQLAPPEPGQPGALRRAALTQAQVIKGLGGIGKTQVAIFFARSRRECDHRKMLARFRFSFSP